GTVGLGKALFPTMYPSAITVTRVRPVTISVSRVEGGPGGCKLFGSWRASGRRTKRASATKAPPPRPTISTAAKVNANETISRRQPRIRPITEKEKMKIKKHCQD